MKLFISITSLLFCCCGMKGQQTDGWSCVVDFNWLQCISSITPAFIAWCYYPGLKK